VLISAAPYARMIECGKTSSHVRAIMLSSALLRPMNSRETVMPRRHNGQFWLVVFA